jgi:2-phosphoglycolate phosphatase
MRFSAVLFDFDGTLVDSFAAIAASVNHVRASRDVAPLAVDEVKRFVGRGAEYLLAHTVPGGDTPHAVEAYKTHHPTVMARLTQLLPGAAETLQRLHSAGLALGLCSNKPRDFSKSLLAHLGIAQHFAVVLGPEDVPRLKPAPDMLETALARLGRRAEETLYVGDMTVDIQTARAAGMAVWVIPTGTDDRAALVAAGPDRVLDRLVELTEILR